MTRGWKKTEKTALLKSVRAGFIKGTPLKQVFVDFAKSSGRKADSVRNFYYSCVAESKLRGETLDGIKKNDIEVFSKKEIEKLLTSILTSCEKGLSVRKAIFELTNDKTKALRYQNKYRNLVKTKSPVLLKILEEHKKKKRYYDPFSKHIVEIRAQPTRTLVADKTLVARNESELSLAELLTRSQEKNLSEKNENAHSL